MSMSLRWRGRYDGGGRRVRRRSIRDCLLEVEAGARSAETPESERRALIEQGLNAALQRLTAELGPERSDWRHGRLHASELPHMLAPQFDLPTVERPGGFGAVNATGANFRRIIDLANLPTNVVW